MLDWTSQIFDISAKSTQHKIFQLSFHMIFKELRKAKSHRNFLKKELKKKLYFSLIFGNFYLSDLNNVLLLI